MLTLIRKLAKFRALSGSDRRVVLNALLLLPVFRANLWLWGLNRLYGWPGRAPAREQLPLKHEDLIAIGALVNSAAHQVLGTGNCLTRSLYLQWLLRRRGVPSDLRIGVKLRHGQFEAHAWVEVLGQPINDAPSVAERFAAFDQQPLSAERLFSL